MFEKKNNTQIKDKFYNYYRNSAPYVWLVKKEVYSISLWLHKLEWRRTIEENSFMVLTDPTLKVLEILEAYGISHGLALSIMIDCFFCMRMLSRWVSCLLTIVHNCNRVSTLRECLALIDFNSDKFGRRFITNEKTSVHHNIANKFMMTVFLWCMPFNSYRSPSKGFLDRFNDDLRRERRYWAKNKVLFHQNNVLEHTSGVAMT